MQILLIEDDPFKQELIESAIKAIIKSAVIIVARSVQQAVHALRLRRYDRVFLDIALPSHESRPGGAAPISQPSGGIEILLELAYEERDDSVVIVTQYPEIEYNGRFYRLSRARQALSDNIGVNILDAIYFNAQDNDWRKQLGKTLG